MAVVWDQVTRTEVLRAIQEYAQRGKKFQDVTLSCGRHDAAGIVPFLARLRGVPPGLPAGLGC